MTISNSLNDISQTDAWEIELMFIIRYGFIFIILIYFYSKDFFEKRILLFFIFISVMIQSLDGIYQSIYGYDFFKHTISDYKGGLTGAVFHRNVFGFLMGLSLLVFVLYVVKNLYKKREISINLIFVMIFCLFLYSTMFSFSRAVWVALAASSIIYIIMNLKYLKIKHLIYSSIFITLMVLIFVNNDLLFSRFNSLLEGNSSHRFQIWSKGLELISEKPIFGWGIDTWHLYGLKEHTALHNSILEILMYTGVAGLLSFIILVMMTLKTIIMSKNRDLLLVFIYFFVDSLFDHSIFESKIFLTFLTIFMFYIYVYRVEKNQNECNSYFL